MSSQKPNLRRKKKLHPIAIHSRRFHFHPHLLPTNNYFHPIPSTHEQRCTQLGCKRNYVNLAANQLTDNNLRSVSVQVAQLSQTDRATP